MIHDSGEENLLQPQLGGPPCHLEGAEVQLASLLEGDPQTSPRDPGERTPAETYGECQTYGEPELVL